MEILTCDLSDGGIGLIDTDCSGVRIPDNTPTGLKETKHPVLFIQIKPPRNMRCHFWLAYTSDVVVSTPMQSFLRK